ncbi:MAG: DNA polymerase III subunit delta [Prevotellaceae bacterium]|jgi:DNA polymerase-3 subunit delta|nr:DNA polymerase III subunit delta [Prevotellaceae bacterium]
MAKFSGKDTITKYGQILSDLKNKIYRPIYVLMGEEVYYIDKLSEFIANNVLSESERSFNQTVIYGKDVSEISLITDAARRFPMMANYQVIIVREAQVIKDIDKLEPYIKNPLKSTILVICYKGKTIDKRTAFYKTILQQGEVLESVKLYENEVPSWISTYVKQQGFEIEPNAAVILADFLGINLSRTVNELNKLFTVLPENRKKINALDIENNIGISRDYNTFELSKAVSNRDVLRANKICLHFIKNAKEYPFVVTISTLFSQFSKVMKYHALRRQRLGSREIIAALGINPFFIKDYEIAANNYNMLQTAKIISLLREYDMKSKGMNYVAADSGELLRELISKIFNIDSIRYDIMK